MSAYYGCTACQRTHWEGDTEFQEHIHKQDKHSVQQGLNPDPRREFLAIAKRYKVSIYKVGLFTQAQERVLHFDTFKYRVLVEGYFPPSGNFLMIVMEPDTGNTLRKMSGNAYELCNAFKREFE